MKKRYLLLVLVLLIVSGCEENPLFSSKLDEGDSNMYQDKDFQNIIATPEGINKLDDSNKNLYIVGDGNVAFSLDDESITKLKGYDGYIIELEDQSLLRLKNNLESQGKSYSEIKNALSLQKTKIESKQNSLRQDIASIDSDIETTYNYNTVFNGIAITETDHIDKIKKLSGVKKVHPNYIVQATLMDSVPIINAPQVWQMTDSYGNPLTGRNMIISIIDTGIDYTHGDLGGCFGEECRVIDGYDFINNDPDPIDDQGHGTHCAGIAAGNGVLVGVAPEAKLYAYKVLDSGGSGSDASVIAGIERSMDPNQDLDYSDAADVLSLSLGGGGNPDSADSIAVDTAVSNGAVVVVAAGNSGPSYQTIGCPGCARDALTVGAIDKDLIIADFSSRGPVIWPGGELTKPDVLAPGVNICAAQYDDAWYESECFDDEHTAISGTSMATPHVAGASALIRQAHPDWTPQDIKEILMLTATDLGYDENTQGTGLINVVEAVSLYRVAEVRPFVSTFTLLPKNSTSEGNQTFTVTNIDNASNQFFFGYGGPAMGIDISIDNDFEVLEPGEETTVTLEFTVDHDFISSNQQVLIQFVVMYGPYGEDEIRVPIYLNIEPEIEIAPDEFDMGTNPPSEEFWNSDFVFNVHNIRQDSPNELLFEVECCEIKDKEGTIIDTINYEEIPNFNIYFDDNLMTFNPDETKENSFNIEVDNQYLINGIYEGTIHASNDLLEMDIPFSFKKFYVLNVIFDEESPLFTNGPPPFNFLAKDDLLVEESIFPTDNIEFLIDEGGVYDFYSFTAYHGIIHWLMEENINVDWTSEVIINEEDAPSSYEIDYVDQNNQPLVLNGDNCRGQFVLLSENSDFGVAGDIQCNSDGPIMMSGGSQKPFFFTSTFTGFTDEGTNKYTFEEILDGLFTDTIFSNTPEDLISRRIDYSEYQEPSRPMMRHSLQLGPGFLYSSIWYPLFLENHREIQGFFKESEDHPKKFWFSTGIFDPQNYVIYKESPYLLHQENTLGLWYLKTFTGPNYVYSLEEPVLNIGKSFEFWHGWMTGYNQLEMDMESPSGDLHYFFPQSLTIERPKEDIPYELYKDGEIVSQGSLYGIGESTSWFRQTIPLFGYGDYELKVAHIYNVNDEIYESNLRLIFNNMYDQPLPPYLKYLRIYSNDVLSDTIYQDEALAFKVGVEQEYPFIDIVSLTIHYKSGEIQEYILAEENGDYVLGIETPIEKIDHISLLVMDEFEHGFEYDFEIPYFSSCEETDDGVDQYNYGEVTYLGDVYEDVCIPGTQDLIEYYCGEYGVGTEDINCLYGCGQGKCSRKHIPLEDISMERPSSPRDEDIPLKSSEITWWQRILDFFRN